MGMLLQLWPTAVGAGSRPTGRPLGGSCPRRYSGLTLARVFITGKGGTSKEPK